MATLNKHGECIKLKYLWYTVAFCQDGNILRNTGDGWKTYKKLKAGVEWRGAAGRAEQKRDGVYRDRPMFKALKDFVDDLCPSMEKRQHLRVGLEMLADDPDGLYTELQDTFRYDGGLECDLDDIVKLCRLYNLAREEK